MKDQTDRRTNLLSYFILFYLGSFFYTDYVHFIFLAEHTEHIYGEHTQYLTHTHTHIHTHTHTHTHTVLNTHTYPPPLHTHTLRTTKTNNSPCEAEVVRDVTCFMPEIDEPHCMADLH